MPCMGTVEQDACGKGASWALHAGDTASSGGAAAGRRWGAEPDTAVQLKT
jgi:hypothetical protein